MYAVGQGALAIECREDDLVTLELLESLHHGSTALRVLAERSLLKELNGGCSAPVAVKTTFINGQLSLKAGVWSLDGKETLNEFATCNIEFTDSQEKPTPK